MTDDNVHQLRPDGHAPLPDVEVTQNALLYAARRSREGGHPACADQGERIAGALSVGHLHLTDLLRRLATVNADRDGAVAMLHDDVAHRGEFLVRVFLPPPRTGAYEGHDRDLAVALDQALTKAGV